MNLASVAGEAGANMLFGNFNQDCSSLAVGTKSGYRLFSLSSIEKLDQIYESEGEDICIVERLFSSSLVAVVSLSSPRKLKVCHFKKGTEICNYSYSNTILAVRLNRQRLLVCLEESLYIHNIRDMKVLHTIRDTPPNPSGLCALSTHNDSCLLAYPGSCQIGEVQLFDCMSLRAKLMIPAHDAPLAAIAFNPSGSKLATASERGTVIRLFNVTDGTRLLEFRRGVKRCAHVYSLAFSQDSEFLALSSNTETIHIFKLDQGDCPASPVAEVAPQGGPGGEGEAGWMGYLSKAVACLPAQVTDTLAQSRAWATVSVPSAGVPNIVTIATLTKQTRLMLASADGYFYIYNIPEQGGDCVMVKQHRLDPECGGEVEENEGSAKRDCPAVIPVSQQEEHSPGQESPPPVLQVQDS